LALTPQTVTPAFPALTGAETRDDWSPEPLDVPMFVLLLALLVCVVGAAELLCVLSPAALMLTPDTDTCGFPALTGAETALSPLPEPALLLLLVWDTSAPVLLCVASPAALAFTPVTVTPALPALMGAETTGDSSPDPFAVPAVDELVEVVGAPLLLCEPSPRTLTLTPETLTVGLAALTGAETRDPSSLPVSVCDVVVWVEPVGPSANAAWHPKVMAAIIPTMRAVSRTSVRTDARFVRCMTYSSWIERNCLLTVARLMSSVV
jgi:hypothetical protein